VQSSVVIVAGICSSVGGGVILTCHRGAGGEYRSVSGPGLLIGNWWIWQLWCLSCAGMR